MINVFEDHAEHFRMAREIIIVINEKKKKVEI